MVIIHNGGEGMSLETIKVWLFVLPVFFIIAAIVWIILIINDIM